MQDYKRQFIEFSINKQVITFGDFTLKSGRQSPWFFNAGLFNHGSDLAQLGRFYAAALMAADLEFDVLFGPAYKGIPLVSSTAIALADHYHRDLPYCFNRKEVKDHGEGGNLIGSPLSGRVVLIDDVITAGSAIRESMALIEAAGASLAGVVIALDRQERGTGALSAIQQAERDYGCRVIAIANLHDVLEYLQHCPEMAQNLTALQTYYSRYGAASEQT